MKSITRAVCLLGGLLIPCCISANAESPAKPAVPAEGTVTSAAPVYGLSNPAPDQTRPAQVRYYASVVALDPEKEKKYRELHADVWPEVVAAIRRAHIRNYHIFVATVGKQRLLFSFFEYTGTDPDADFAAIARDEVTRDRWWPVTDACQIRLPGTPEGSQWLDLEQVMHLP